MEHPPQHSPRGAGFQPIGRPVQICGRGGSDVQGTRVQGFITDARDGATGLQVEAGFEQRNDASPPSIHKQIMGEAAASGGAEASVMFNTIVTNVPGAPFQLYMCGAELVDTISLGPLLPNVGLFHIVYSSVQDKKGTINLSFTACRDMLPDPDFYATCLQESFDELRHAALNKNAKPVGKSNSRKTARKKSA